MIHLDLFGPVNIMKINKKKYALVVVDDYTRFTWVYFLNKKDETPQLILELIKVIERNSEFTVNVLRSDNGTEFKNSSMEEYCASKGITQQFSSPGTPQQNGVVERKNMTLIEAARTMLAEVKLPTYFWAEAVNTTFFTHNCTLVNMHGKTPYEMIKGKKPSVKHFHIFGCRCFVLKVHPENLSKFDTKADEAIFLGYATGTRAFKVYNLRTKSVMESIHVSFDDKKIDGLQNEESHDTLIFENKEDLENDSSESEDQIPKAAQVNASPEGEQEEEDSRRKHT